LTPSYVAQADQRHRLRKAPRADDNSSISTGHLKGEPFPKQERREAPASPLPHSVWEARTLKGEPFPGQSRRPQHANPWRLLLGQSFPSQELPGADTQRKLTLKGEAFPSQERARNRLSGSSPALRGSRSDSSTPQHRTVAKDLRTKVPLLRELAGENRGLKSSPTDPNPFASTPRGGKPPLDSPA
jgi:hypothetical protein